MKICRKCREEFSDKVTKCLYCGGPVEVVFIPGEEKVEETEARPKKFSGLENIWKDHKIIITASIVLLLVIAFAASQMSNLKSDKEQASPIENPEIDAPAFSAPFNTEVPETAPPMESAATPGTTSEEAFRLMKNAYALCSSGKCANPEQAIEYLNEAIKLRPDLAEAYNNRGNAYSDLKQYEQAIDDYNEAIRLKPGYAHAYYNRALTYGELGQHQQAIEDYNAVIQFKPEETSAYYNRGSAYFKLGNKELGCRDAQKACELGNCALLEKAQKKKDCP